MVQQQPSDTAARAVRVHRYLLDVEVAVDAVGDQIGDRGVGVAGRDPGHPGVVVAGELTDREWLVVGNLRHADISEALSGGPLDVLEGGQFVQAYGSDMHGRHCPRSAGWRHRIWGP
jgi:hypothetical protein